MDTEVVAPGTRSLRWQPAPGTASPAIPWWPPPSSGGRGTWEDGQGAPAAAGRAQRRLWSPRWHRGHSGRQVLGPPCAPVARPGSCPAPFQQAASSRGSVTALETMPQTSPCGVHPPAGPRVGVSGGSPGAGSDGPAASMPQPPRHSRHWHDLCVPGVTGAAGVALRPRCGSGPAGDPHPSPAPLNRSFGPRRPRSHGPSCSPAAALRKPTRGTPAHTQRPCIPHLAGSQGRPPRDPKPSWGPTGPLQLRTLSDVLCECKPKTKQKSNPKQNRGRTQTLCYRRTETIFSEMRSPPRRPCTWGGVKRSQGTPPQQSDG